MNYTYLASNPFSDDSRFAAHTIPPGPVIIMTTNPSSKKTLNLVSNPNVSLLVHDWVTHRPPNQQRSTSPDGRRDAGRSSLASLLMGMNTSAMGSISATINGTAQVLQQGSEEEKWCKAQHLANNTFDTQDSAPSSSFLSPSPSRAGTTGDGGREFFIEDDEVRVVVVRIRDGRIADWKGGVRDWVLAADEERLVNGTC